MRHTKKCIGLLVAATIAVQAVLPGSVADAKKYTRFAGAPTKKSRI